jgi:hypothetical protein
LVVLFIVSFLLFQSVYGYVIGFQNETNDCFFVIGRPFLLEFLDHPAGPLRYAGRFIGQFYHYRWLGTLIVSASIACFGFLFHRVLAKLDRTAPVFQALLPCVLLLVLHTSTLCLAHDTIGLCASCAAFLGYLSLRGKLARRVYALVATPIAYFLLGFYAWFFVAWVLVSEWIDGPLRSGLPFKIGYVVFSLAVPLAAWRWVFPISLRGAVMCPLMLDPPFRTGSSSQTFVHFVVDCSLALVLFALLLVVPFWGRLFSGTRFVACWQAKLGTRSRVALAITLPVLAILLHFIRYDASLATVVACRQLYKQRQWDALLERAKRNPHGNLRVQFMTNFALCQKGRLLDEMFSYPQPWGTRGLVLNFSGKPGLSPAADDTRKGMYNSDLFYEMGHINAALRHAYNCMSVQERTYDSMKRMAECSMVNGNYDMAAKYLNILERTVFHRGFARRYKAIIADSDAAEREFGDLRKRLPVVDGHMFGDPVMPFLVLLDASPDNRMALDYLMAWLLLDKSENSIVSICCPEGIQHISSAGYASIPIHCQEAMLLWERVERARVDLQGYGYDDATVARVDKFFQDLSPYLARPPAPEHARALYGDMYVFYHFFVATPGESQRTRPASRGFGGTLRQE